LVIPEDHRISGEKFNPTDVENLTKLAGAKLCVPALKIREAALIKLD
jgi:hypothetical protein